MVARHFRVEETAAARMGAAGDEGGSDGLGRPRRIEPEIRPPVEGHALGTHRCEALGIVGLERRADDRIGPEAVDQRGG
jgi:hypothetical protein